MSNAEYLERPWSRGLRSVELTSEAGEARRPGADTEERGSGGDDGTVRRRLALPSKPGGGQVYIDDVDQGGAKPGGGGWKPGIVGYWEGHESGCQGAACTQGDIRGGINGRGSTEAEGKAGGTLSAAPSVPAVTPGTEETP